MAIGKFCLARLPSSRTLQKTRYVNNRLNNDNYTDAAHFYLL